MGPNEGIKRLEENFDVLDKFIAGKALPKKRLPRFVASLGDLVHNFRDSDIVKEFKRSNPALHVFSRVNLKKKTRRDIFEKNTQQLRLLSKLLLDRFFTVDDDEQSTRNPVEEEQIFRRGDGGESGNVPRTQNGSRQL